MSRRLFIFWVALGLLTWSAGDHDALAQRSAICDFLAYQFDPSYKNLNKVVEASVRDSSVEVETVVHRETLALLTTTDGTIRPLVEGGVKIPGFILKIAKSKGIDDVFDIKWDDLTYAEKTDLLTAITAQRKTDFFADRVFHGLRVRSTFSVSFENDTLFLGETYPAGNHNIDISSYVKGRVEYMGPDDIKNGVFTGFEWHFRGPIPAGDLSQSLRVLQKGLGIRQTHQHVHIVAPMPLRRLNESPDMASFELADHFRRSNLFFEMTNIVLQGQSINRRSVGPVTYWDNLSERNLRGVYNYLRTVGFGDIPRIGDSYKMGYVGFRGSDKYDQGGLLGYEVRAIGSSGQLASDLNPALTAIQHYLYQFDSMPANQRFLSWWKVNGSTAPPHKLDDVMASLWYNRELPDLFDTAHAQVKELLKEPQKRSLMAKLFRRGPKNRQEKLKNNYVDGEDIQTKMLIHDWTKDPLLHNQPKLQEKVLEAQIDALQKLDPESSSVLVVREFLLKSGLHNLFRASLSGA